MKSMFGFFDMTDDYEERKVENTIINGVEIDTVGVTDADKDYETGVLFSLYNNNDWVIVEEYDTRDEAIEGHKKWVKIFSDKENFPKEIKDVSSTILGRMCREFDED